MRIIERNDNFLDDNFINELCTENTNNNKKTNHNLKPIYVDVLKILCLTLVLVALIVLIAQIIGQINSSQYRIYFVFGIISGGIVTFLIFGELLLILNFKGKYHIKIEEN